MKLKFLRFFGIPLGILLVFVLMGVAAAAGMARFQVSQQAAGSLSVSAFTVLDSGKMRITSDVNGVQPVKEINFIGLKRSAPLGGLELVPVDVYYGNLSGMDMHLVQPCYMPIYDASKVTISKEANIARAQAAKAPLQVIANLQAGSNGGAMPSVPPIEPPGVQVGYINATIYSMDGSFGGNACDQQGVNVTSGKQIRLQLQPYLWNDKPEVGIYSISIVFGAVDGPNAFSDSVVCLSCGKG